MPEAEVTVSGIPYISRIEMGEEKDEDITYSNQCKIYTF